MSCFFYIFLKPYVDSIIAYFDSDVQSRIEKNFKDLKYFVIGDLLKNGFSDFISGTDSIHMDESYADIATDSFTIKPEFDYIETMLVHKLLHSVIRNPDKKYESGIIRIVNDHKINVGLNEGITCYLSERISHKTDPDEVHLFSKQLVYLLGDVIGENVIKSSYVKNSDELEKTINSIAGDADFFSELSSMVDSINKINRAIKRIETGVIKPVDSSCLDTMKAVSEAQKARVTEMVFSKVVLPKLKGIPFEKRAKAMVNLGRNNPEILKCVEKYIPLLTIEVDWSDERIASIQKEIDEGGINFDSIKKATMNLLENGTEEQNEADINTFSEKIKDFYNANDSAFNNSRSTTMTPLLREELKNFVVTRLMVLEDVAETEEQKAEVERFRTLFLKKYFRNIPNIEEEIEKIKKEMENTKTAEEERKSFLEKVRQQGSSEAEIVAHKSPYGTKKENDLLEKARKIGASEAKKDAHLDPKKQEEKKNYLSLNFVYSDITGEVFDQRSISIYQKAVNITRATGEMIDLEDKSLVDVRKSSADSYLANIPQSSVERLQKLYGDDWQKIIREAYESGFKAGMKGCMEKATKEGADLRTKDAKMIAKKEPLPMDEKKVDLEELKFCYDNFTINKKEKGIEVVDKNGKVINSPRTRNMVMFANQWVMASSKDLAFSELGKQLYALIRKHSQQDLEKNGMINISNLKGYSAYLDDVGPTFSQIADFLFRNEAKSKFMDSYFRMQTPDAVEYPPVAREATTENKHSSK